MRKLAIDTNIVLTWLGLQSTTLQPKSKLLFDSIAGKKLELVAPAFLLVELVNVLTWRLTLREREVEEIIKLVMRAGITFVPIGKNAADKVVTLVFEHDLTAYDALFLYVAMIEECTLVTADQKLLDVKTWCVDLEEVDL